MMFGWSITEEQPRPAVMSIWTPTMIKLTGRFRKLYYFQGENAYIKINKNIDTMRWVDTIVRRESITSWTLLAVKIWLSLAILWVYLYKSQ